MLCPAEVRFVCLSATVNNANELGGWLRSVRGDTSVIVERHRPIVLRHHFAVHRREDGETLLCPLLQDNGQPGGEGLRIDQAVRRALQSTRSAALAGAGEGAAPALSRAPADRDGRGARAGSRCCRPSSSSSAGPPATTRCIRSCATACASPTRPSAPPSAQSSSAGSSRSTTTISGVLGYDEWLEGLERGVAAHHAGLVPVFRETVEECFAAGLLKVVFATETLSLGINMPARSVVIERFTKYGGCRPGHAHLGGVPAAHRSGRAPGARRGGPRRRRLVERDHLRRGRPGGVGPAARPALGLPPHLQPRRQPGGALRPGHGRAPCCSAPSPSGRPAQPDLLLQQLGHRVAVLEQTWATSRAGA